ncbi:MAG TPA: hypothetical protein PJ988_10100, partial [Anaerolinea sp.]|nr:hypothetical protein [Anaerolinea sp.]
MSKKQIANRLNDLFSSLVPSPETVQHPVEMVSPAPELAGWSWAVDQDGKYTDCGPEVSTCLGVDAASFIGKTVWAYRIDPPSGQQFNQLLHHASFPAEIDVLIEDASYHWIPARFCVLSGPDSAASGWRGLVQLIPAGASSVLPQVLLPQVPSNGRAAPEAIPQVTQPAPAVVDYAAPQKDVVLPKLSGVAISAEGKKSAETPFTEAGRESLVDKKVKVTPSQPDRPAAIAVPISTKEMGDLLLEVVDETDNRKWNEDER